MQDFDEMADLSQEELEYLDAIVSAFGEQIEADEERTSFLNLDTKRLMTASFLALKKAIEGDSVKVQYHPHEPYTSMGFISITGKNVHVTDPKMFSAISQLASNMEAFPKTDGSIQINLTFHGLTEHID